MISMTNYWQQFNDCIDNLQAAAEEDTYSKQISTARSLIKIGLTIEQLDLLTVKNISNQLAEIAKQYAHEVSYTSDDIEYRFNLPKIVNTESLIFAINYYQHLTNYENVSYQGSINWFRQMVVDGINEKKVTTRIQSKAMLEEIKHYCNSNNIVINELQFLKNKNEISKDYIQRIAGLITAIHNEEESESSSVSEEKSADKPNGLMKLQQLLDDLNNKKDQLKIKSERFFKKLTDLEHAKQTHSILNKEWQNKGMFIRFFYWVASWVYNVPLINNLKMAQEQLAKAENELNLELPPKTAESYKAKLKKQLDELNNACENAREQIDLQTAEQAKQQQIKLEQTKPPHLQLVPVIQKDQEIRKENHQDSPEIEDLTDSETESDTETESETQTNSESENASSNVNYYGFFTEHLPSKAAMGAIAAGVAAIVVQNLTYS